MCIRDRDQLDIQQVQALSVAANQLAHGCTGIFPCGEVLHRVHTVGKRILESSALHLAADWIIEIPGEDGDCGGISAMVNGYVAAQQLMIPLHPLTVGVQQIPCIYDPLKFPRIAC